MIYRNIILSIILTCSACSIKISNTYIAEHSKLTLNSDSSYYYEYHLGWHYFYSEGKWQLLKSTVVLNGMYPDLDNLPVEVAESSNANQGNITIEVKSRSGNFHNVNHTLKYIVKSQEGNTYEDTSHILSLPKSFSKDFLKIYILRSDTNLIPLDVRHQISSSSFKIHDNNNNIVTIVFPVDEKAFNYDNLKCDTLKVKRNKLQCLNRKQEVFTLKRSKN